MYPTDRKWLRSPSERVGTLSHADLPPPTASDADEQLLLHALRQRNEAAFEWLLDRYNPPMLRLAQTFLRSPEEAEEAVQDTWVGVLAGLDRFQGRSSLRTWIFRILVNRARSRAKREARQLPFSSMAWSDEDQESPVDALLAAATDRGATWAGSGWEPAPPDDDVLAAELRAAIDDAIGTLPPRQQTVVKLRDVDGWSPDEVCSFMHVSEANQRVLLHRARAGVRQALRSYTD